MYTIPVDIKRHVKRDFTAEDFTKYGAPDTPFRKTFWKRKGRENIWKARGASKQVFT